MKLLSFSVINYKSAKLIDIKLSPDQVNTFIGVNDSGKSTIMQALGLFFQDKPVISFQTETTQKTVLSNSRLSVEDFETFFRKKNLPHFPNYDQDLICIYTQFEIEKEFSHEDLELFTEQFQCCLEGKATGDIIHILRVFQSDGSRAEYYLLCDDFEDSDGVPHELWNQTEKSIKDVQMIFEIDDKQIENRNEAGKLKKIERILAIHQKAETNPRWSVFDFKKNSDSFPQYEYLDWNIGAEEINSLTTAVIQPVVSKLVEPLQQTINKESKGINSAANDELKKLYDEYQGDLPETIKGISAHINIALSKSVTELFVEKHTSDQKIHIDEQGDGLKRQIKIGLLKALAQKSIEDDEGTKKYIWCFDEPETHLFPSAQRELARSFAKLADARFQVMVSTHSTLFVDRSQLTDINLVTLSDGYSTLRSTESTEDIYQTLGVRNSDFLFFNRFIAVEGATEMGVLDHFYRLIYKSSLAEDGIQLISLGGETNAGVCVQLLDDIFSDFQKPDDIVVYLFDKDSGRTGGNVFQVGATADFEDEIGNDVWTEAIRDSCSLEISNDQLAEIRSHIEVSAGNKKMHKLLNRHISAETSQAERLPDKGEELAKLLVRHINDESKIPQSIKAAFLAVRKGL